MDFYQILILVIIVSFIPIIRFPLNIFSTYLHEISHALMAKAGFSSVTNIVLKMNGSGSCTSYSQNAFHAFLISIAGYFGNSLFGLTIYTIGRLEHSLITEANITLVLILLLIGIILWVRDFTTFFLHLCIVLIFILPFYINLNEGLELYLQFIGIYVILQSIIAPLHLIDGLDDGDGGRLQKMTYIPEGFWITLWISFAVYCLYRAYIIS